MKAEGEPAGCQTGRKLHDDLMLKYADMRDPNVQFWLNNKGVKKLYKRCKVLLANHY